MIFDTQITGISESSLDALLENTEDRFEYNTIAEATAIVVGEQEENWNKFMTAVGLSELNSVMEGEEVIYEGARLQKFFDKAKAYFKMALNKLAEITKSFMAKVDSIFRTNNSFIKKYETQLKNAKVKDFEFEGYEFENLLDKTPTYDKDEPFKLVTDPGTAKAIIADSKNNTDYTKEVAEEKLTGLKESDGTFMERLTKIYYGSKDKVTFKDPHVDTQIKVIKDTKNLKKDAKKSHSEAHKAIGKIIKELEKAQKKAAQEAGKDKDTDIGGAASIDQAYSIMINYWKSYSSCALLKHSAYMRALGARNRQAKAICAKVIRMSLKAEGKDKRNDYRRAAGMDIKEGYIDSSAFLDAVDFI